MKNQGIFNKGIYKQVPAHELGHGAFGLKHTFDPEYGVSDNPQITRALNLMGYNDQVHLAKFQWDIIHQHSGETAFDSTDAVMARFTIIDSKHTQLFNHVYDNNLNPYKAGAGSYQTEDWPVAWMYSDDKPEELVDKVINKLRNAASGQTAPKITLRDNGIYVGKHTVGNNEYATAIYSRKAVIGGIKKVTVSDIKDLEKYHVLKQPLYCETAYANYVVIAFYEDDENDPSLIIQATQGKTNVFSNEQLEAWMKYVGVMREEVDEEIVLNNMTWVSQRDATLFGQCTGCWTSSCCRRAAEYMMGNTGMANCSDSTIAASAPYMPTSGSITTAYFHDNISAYTKETYNSATLNYNAAKTDEAVAHVKNRLKANRPVLIGVHYVNRSLDPPNNKNKATRHFMVVVGYIKEKNGTEYFLFYDPGQQINNQTLATSPNNKLTINWQQGSIQGYYDGKTYTITEIIKTN